jgi:hypothetical protein
LTIFRISSIKIRDTENIMNRNVQFAAAAATTGGVCVAEDTFEGFAAGEDTKSSGGFGE